MPSRFVSSKSSLSLAAPSSIEYSVWTWRWVNPPSFFVAAASCAISVVAVMLRTSLLPCLLPAAVRADSVDHGGHADRVDHPD
ncbi:hypothetical protein ACFFX0_06095 [Citricoccus parietis]|uniref:Uncharacterized protein n=1 Tax=Citricoccus parietis TaxID=592307 RepID=A0ABV5FVS1_9MICC